MVGLCRLCASLRKMDALVTINDDSNDIREKLRKCCALDIKMSDLLPKSICRDCIENLSNSYKFYKKVEEAQETLQALYPSSITNNESKRDSQDKHSIQVKMSECKENPKQNPSEELLGEEKYTVDNITAGILSKKLKLDNCLIEENKNTIKESQADKRNTNTDSGQTKEDFIQEVYTMLDMTKEEEISGSPYVLLETIEETTEYLSEDETVISGENDEHSDEVVKHINDTTPDDQLNLEVEYVVCCEEEESIEIADVDHAKGNPSITNSLKLKSWKDYKHICFICDEKFANFVELKRHTAQAHNTTEIDKMQYKCYDCKKIIPRYNFFLNHVRSKHHHDLKLHCDACDLSCKNFEDLSHHRRVNCPYALNYADTIPCNKCFKTFDNIFGLQNHCKYQHNSSNRNIKYKCMQCNKEFKYKSCLKSHQQIHTDKKKFCCSYCDRSFYNKLGLDQHQYVHVNEKKYQCNICNKSYKTFRILDEHQKLHTDEKPFKCQFCDKAFSQKIQRVTHERSHTAKMPYPCKQCGKRFRYRSAIIAHSRIHSGDKPYACLYCIKTFADSSNRNKHVRRMHSNSNRKGNIQK